MTITTEPQARCISVTSNDRRWTVTGGELGGDWIVVDHEAGNRIVQRFRPELGLDAYGVLVRWLSQRAEMRRVMQESAY